jgi:hypothetical protein
MGKGGRRVEWKGSRRQLRTVGGEVGWGQGGRRLGSHAEDKDEAVGPGRALSFVRRVVL